MHAWGRFLLLERQLHAQRERVRLAVVAAMEARGWGLAELARRARHNRSNMGQFLRGRRWNSVAAQKAVRVLGLEPAGPPRPSRQNPAGRRLRGAEKRARDREIVALARGGMPRAELAARFGLGPSYVDQIRRQVRGARRR